MGEVEWLAEWEVELPHTADSVDCDRSFRAGEVRREIDQAIQGAGHEVGVVEAQPEVSENAPGRQLV